MREREECFPACLRACVRVDRKKRNELQVNGETQRDPLPSLAVGNGTYGGEEAQEMERKRIGRGGGN